MTNNNPSIDPADNSSLAGTMTFVFNKLMKDMAGMLPAQVIKYDRDTNRVQVQLLIKLKTTDGSEVSRPQLSSIPVFVFGGGGFRLSFPLQTGDKGWVIANDRDISLFLQSYDQGAPNTGRIKSFSDGVFFPDVMTGLDTIDPSDAEKVVLSNNDGSFSLVIGEDSINIKNQTNTVKISLGATSIDIAATVAVNVTAPVLAVTGNITATGTITPGV